MSKKFLISLQHWDGDYEQSKELLELFADTIEENNPWADLCVFTRFDSKPMPEELILRLQKVFSNVWEKKSKTVASGWPNGCNAMWHDLAMVAYTNSTQSSFGEPEWEKYKAVFSIESDCCPLTKDWLRDLSMAWDKYDTNFIGAWSWNNDDHNRIPECVGHINGNAMWAIDLVRKCPSLIGTPHAKGWDTWHAPELRKCGWQGAYEIRNMYNTQEISRETINHLISEGAAFLHGVKDGSARAIYLSRK